MGPPALRATRPISDDTWHGPGRAGNGPGRAGNGPGRAGNGPGRAGNGPGMGQVEPGMSRVEPGCPAHAGWPGGSDAYGIPVYVLQ